jgi:hypothetical protein
MTLVLSANKIGSDTEFILRGRSFIYIMNNRAPGTDPWRTPHSMYPSEKIFSAVLGGFIQFCLLLVKKDLNPSSDAPQIPRKCNLANKIS